MSILSVNMGDQPVSPQGSTDIAADIGLIVIRDAFQKFRAVASVSDGHIAIL
ncbi:hypothetical protein HBH56_064850 [Parastagonospora nodorum]|uniref:Uncharacterized protein n=1 Tax=Phaeosphaeria nodorum (strain SN15 / ATCC MYA-4574 / FGSC 10173) TaxID=321614 RepID=A0A7U2EYC1_PHANO|nr:hypothetical protein HBH56_064850 [Parastagonospora nodorum]QRC93214.1 hypothetical protein JI435_429130 [Parastagonospora nodorum SN15]KAH4143742.1 hypothetical protein HBH45_038260 [Parastagonospora nodorum]KAH4167319.1 hypothetical protein HBH43_126740 [Parastagonospora nodorum]KAH4417138.1 hypothetical protein HBH92_063020 [Parastagonospora nodorum]